MNRATIWGREVAMQGSPLTLLHYRREFGGDFMADMLEHCTPEGMSVEWLLRACWAMCRTHDPDTSPYEKWLDEFPADGIDLAEPVAAVIYSAIAAEMFRDRKAGRAARARRRVAGWLGAVSRRLGA